jgi:hypothetical protein
MASKKGKSPNEGTLIRGADGALYFIPDSEMQAFSVPDEAAAGTNAELRMWASGEKKDALHAVSAVRVPPNIIHILPPKTLRKRKPIVK